MGNSESNSIAFGTSNIGFTMRSFINRVVNFVRPKPRFMPLAVEDVLKNKESLDVVNKFNDFYYTSGVAGDLSWRGSQIIKNPCDLWVIIELLEKLKPTLIIETGTHRGGSSHFYADMLKVFSINCDIITIDINPKWNFNPESKQIHSVVGYSTDSKTFTEVKTLADSILKKRPGHVMVMLDSDHSKDNVIKEMQLYSHFVTKGSYMIVEDTNVNGHPSSKEHGPGPYEAVEEFLQTNKNFRPDLSCQKFLLTFNPNGWLKREN